MIFCRHTRNILLILSVVMCLLLFKATASAQQVAVDSIKNPAYNWWKPSAREPLRWQLQLQGDIVLIPGVNVYAVDYTASQASINAAKAAGAKVMCYISAGSAENWRDDFQQFPKSVVGKAYEGWPGEWWLDTRNIQALAPIMRARIAACAEKGFDVLDPDNINGYENDTGFNITRWHSIEYIEWLANLAHEYGMAFSLKNAESLIPVVGEAVDMMQSESCFFYENCDSVKAMIDLNKPVFAVEYIEKISVQEFRSDICDLAKRVGFSMIHRDTELTPSGPYLSCR